MTVISEPGLEARRLNSPAVPPDTGSLPPAPPHPGLPPSLPRRRIVTRVKWILAGALVMAIGAALVRAWMPKPIPVDLASASRGSLRITVNEDGRTRVRDRYLVSAPLAGTLIRPVVRAGDSVRRGQVVARIVSAALPLLNSRARAEAEGRVGVAEAAREQGRALLARAQAEYDMAQREAARREVLFQGGAISAEELEQVRLTAETARQEVLRARFRLDGATADVEVAGAALLQVAPRLGRERFDLVAPVSGQVLRVLEQSEAAVQPGTPLLEIGDPAGLEIVVDVLSTDAIGIRAGAPVEIGQWGGDAILSGRVRRVEPSAFTRLSALGVEEQRVNVIIDPAGNGWTDLGDGYRVESRILVWEAPQVLKAPAGAIFRHRNTWAVYRVSQGRAQLRAIVLGQRNDTEAEIRSGLAPGDTVVVYPGDNVTNGAAVVPR